MDDKDDNKKDLLNERPIEDIVKVAEKMVDSKEDSLREKSIINDGKT